MRKLIVILAAVGLLGALAAAGASVAFSASTTKTVAIGDDFFKPRNFTIKKNTIVRWVWSDNVDDHQVAQADKRFIPKDGGFQSADQTVGPPFQHRFKKAGTYYIVCTVHPSEMEMKIVVRK